MFNKKSIFSIRKNKIVGACSVLIGTFALSVALGGGEAQAQKVETTSVVTPTLSAQTVTPTVVKESTSVQVVTEPVIKVEQPTVVKVPAPVIKVTSMVENKVEVTAPTKIEITETEKVETSVSINQTERKIASENQKVVETTKKNEESVLEKEEITPPVAKEASQKFSVGMTSESERTTRKIITSIDQKLIAPEVLNEKGITRYAKYFDGSIEIINLKKEEVNVGNLKTQQDYINEIKKLYDKWDQYNITSAKLAILIPEEHNKNSTEDIRRFHTSNYVSKEGYEIVNADYKLALNLINTVEQKYGKLNKEKVGLKSDSDISKGLLASLEYLIKLYKENNAEKNSSQEIKINFSDIVTKKVRTEFTEDINKLPIELKRILPTIRFEELTFGEAETNPENYTIRMRDMFDSHVNKSREARLKDFLHELGHVIDFKSGMYTDTTDLDGNESTGEDVYGLSNSPEWLVLFHKYYADKDNVNTYISQNKNRTLSGQAPSEAFAESFAQYISKRFYGYEYSKSVKHNELSIAFQVNSDDSLYNTSEAYDVFSNVKLYFDRLYKELFEQPREERVDTGIARVPELRRENNQWVYYKNGKRDYTYQGLHRHTNGTLYYVKNSVVDWKYNGTTRYNGNIYYVNKSMVDWKYTGPARFNGNIYYFNKSVVNWKYNGAARFNGNIYYFNKSVVNWKYNGSVNYNGNIYYFRKSVVDWKYNGLHRHTDGKIYYFTKSVVNRKHTGSASLNGNIYYVKNSVVDWTFNGLHRHTDGNLYYFRKSVVDRTYLDPVKYSVNGKIYFVTFGMVDWRYTGWGRYNGEFYWFEKSVAQYKD